MLYREGFPLPDTSDWDTREWWEHIRRHELVIQRCKDCGSFRHSPVPICSECRSFEYEWHLVSGKGFVYSYTIAYHPPSPSLKGVVPYNVVVVELRDAGNVRMVGNLVDVPDERIQVGMAVEVVFHDLTETVTLPQWRSLR